MNIPDKLKSRKLWVTILMTLFGAYSPNLIPILKVLGPAYLVAQRVADSAILARK